MLQVRELDTRYLQLNARSAPDLDSAEYDLDLLGDFVQEELVVQHMKLAMRELMLGK